MNQIIHNDKCIYYDSLSDNIELSAVGYLMALTGNPDINTYAVNKFGKQFGENGSFRLVNTDEMKDPENNPKVGLFSHTDDFMKLTEAVRKYPIIHEISLNDTEHYEGLIEITKADRDIVPLFLKNPDGDVEIIPAFSKEFTDIQKGYKLLFFPKTYCYKSLRDLPLLCLQRIRISHSLFSSSSSSFPLFLPFPIPPHTRGCKSIQNN